MTLKQIAGLTKKLAVFLALFADCFARGSSRTLFEVYVTGQLSDVHRKNVESIALNNGTSVRTLQRFLESIKWEEEKLRDRCQQIVAKDHAHPEAIGCVDESGTPKSGKHTVGVGRQWNGNRGKVDNCVVTVHLSYAAPGFQVLLDSSVYLPEEDWANDPVRRKKNYVPVEVTFRTKPQIAIEQIDRALSNGVRVSAWTFDEFYGRDGKFLDALEERRQLFVGEIPSNFHGWSRQPKVIQEIPKNTEAEGGTVSCRLAAGYHSSAVRNLAEHSPKFRKQTWQRYRIKDTHKGPQVWEIKWAPFWRKDQTGLPTRRHCLLVARNVLTGQVKYFLCNRLPGEWNPHTGQYVTLRWLLRVAFGRWSIESCFRQAKEELGLDHYEVRGWRCLHRHFYITQLSHLFCARVRQEYDSEQDDPLDRISVEQVRSATNVALQAAGLSPAQRRELYEKELKTQQYYRSRNKQAQISHTTTRIQRFADLGIDVNKIKSCVLDPMPPP